MTFRAPFDPEPVEIPTRPTAVDQITGEAGSAALEFVAATTTALGGLARQPVPVLKDGGLGVREIRKQAKAGRVTEAQVTLVLALALARENRPGVRAELAPGPGRDHRVAPDLIAEAECQGRLNPSGGAVRGGLDLTGDDAVRPSACCEPQLINISGLFRSRNDAKGPATLIIREGAARWAAQPQVPRSDAGDHAVPG